jgi:glutamate dehydrogenase (NAD(P)+)
VYVIEAMMERLGWSLADRAVAIQGCGSVGSTLAAELHSRGARVVAVSDHSGGLLDDRGLDVPGVSRWVAENG